MKDEAIDLEPFELEAASLPDSEKEKWLEKFLAHPARGVFALKLRRLIREQQFNLEKATPENLLKIQGTLEGFRIAHSLVSKCSK